MKNECNIIRDILPLYAEGMASADTIAFVEEHLGRCSECREALENLQKPTKLEKAVPAMQDCSTAPLKAFKKKWNKRKRMMIAGTATATFLVIVLIFTALWSPVLFQRGNPIPYLRAASKIDQNTPYVEVSVNSSGSDIYISRMGECPELLAFVSESKNVTFQEQGGSAYLFSNGSDSLCVGSEIYLGKYTVWVVPNKTIQSTESK